MSTRYLRAAGRILLLFAALAATLLTSDNPAAAHTGFESSSPADGETRGEPVFEISITFSGEASPAGDGFVVRSPDGTLRVPDATTSTDRLTWNLRFDEPLVGGVVGVRWSVAAPDAHPIDGSFSFTVSASSTSPIATTTIPPTSAETLDSAMSSTLLPRSSEPQSDTAAGLDAFLTATNDGTKGTTLVARTGRILGLVGAIGAIGGTAFAALVLQGCIPDIRAALVWVRRSGFALILGSIAQAAAQLAVTNHRWSAIWSATALNAVLWSSFGLSIAFRLAGGLMVYRWSNLRVRPEATRRTSVTNTFDRYRPTSNNVASFFGVALVAASFTFDGHTASEGPRWLHAATNLTHVLAASTWAGGVVMLAFVMARRHRLGATTRSFELGVRFSVVASFALVAASVAGVLLTVIIIDSVSEFWTTSWGRLLVLKAGLVLIAAACGGYNHRVIIPALEQEPDKSDPGDQFRTVIAIEALAVAAATVTTGLLIGASTI